MGEKVYSRYKGKILLDVVNKILNKKSLLTMPSNVLPLHLKQTFQPIIWIFTEGEGIESRLPFKIFSTLFVSIFGRPSSRVETPPILVTCNPKTNSSLPYKVAPMLKWSKLSCEKESSSITWKARRARGELGAKDRGSSSHRSTDHGRSMKPFFIEIPNFEIGQTNWADKFLGILGIFGGTIITHFVRVSPLSMFSIIQPLFLQKN